MKKQSLLLKYIGDSPKTRVLDYLLSSGELDICLSDLADHAHIGRATLYRVWNDLISQNILVPTRTIGKAKMYKLNSADPKIKKLMELDEILVLEALRKKVAEKKKIAVVV